jgi:Rrf2 family protein
VKVTRGEEQALRLIAAMARAESQITLTELSIAENMAEPTIAKLMGKLRTAGIVKAVRGRKGGYILNRDPSEIYMSEVMRSLGRPLLEGIDCTPENPRDDECPHNSDCGLRSVMNRLESYMAAVLEKVSIEDMMMPEPVVDLQVKKMTDSNE